MQALVQNTSGGGVFDAALSLCRLACACRGLRAAVSKSWTLLVSRRWPSCASLPLDGAAAWRRFALTRSALAAPAGTRPAAAAALLSQYVVGEVALALSDVTVFVGVHDATGACVFAAALSPLPAGPPAAPPAGPDGLVPLRSDRDDAANAVAARLALLRSDDEDEAEDFLETELLVLGPAPECGTRAWVLAGDDNGLDASADLGMGGVDPAADPSTAFELPLHAEVCLRTSGGRLAVTPLCPAASCYVIAGGGGECGDAEGAAACGTAR